MKPKVADIATSDGSLGPGPGETTTIMLESTGGFHYISIAAMMIPTNDGFIALNGVMAPGGIKQ
ncbi:MAG: spondin domain-containing protein [Nitrospiraceae bacterium]|nr:MAG: spondin domain-containing protein [Nitrospiraceae bacterium]